MVYDLIALRYPAQSRGQTAYYRHVLPRVIRAASEVVTISEAVRAELLAWLPDLTPSRVTVIPSYSERMDRPVARELPWIERQSRGVVACVGARYRHKNLGLVAAALLQPSCRDLALVVTGCDQALWPDLAPLAATGRLTVHGTVTDEDLDAIYGSALVLVYPSRAEGQGMPPLEAATAGCPAVCADIPVLHETCDNAVFYVDPDDAEALAALLVRLHSGTADQEVAMRVAAGRLRAHQFGQVALRRRWQAFLENAR